MKEMKNFRATKTVHVLKTKHIQCPPPSIQWLTCFFEIITGFIYYDNFHSENSKIRIFNYFDLIDFLLVHVHLKGDRYTFA